MRRFLLLSLLAAVPAPGAIIWTGAADTDIFNEANWDLSGSAVTAIDPNVSIDDDVLFQGANVSIPELAGQVRFQIGDGFTVTVDNSTISAAGNDGFGGAPATANGPVINVVNGSAFDPFFIVNDVLLNIASGTSATFGGGGNPINLSTVDLEPGGVLAFLNETPDAYLAEHLGKTFVNGSPAVVDGNILLEPLGGAGSRVTAVPEPGVSLLLGLAGFALLRRRR